MSLHAYTATATARVRGDIASQLGLQDPIELVGSFDRPNLLYRVLPRAVLKRQLLDILDRHRGEPGIIYCTSRREVDALAAWLTALGTPALPYHAGLSDEERRRNQDAFLSERVDVMVATVAFGMGIDRSNVRFVVHAGAPRSLEHYQQESGRAGRDGLEAECVLISSAADFMKWRLMLEQSGELSDASQRLLRQMERYATGVGCRHRHLAEYFGDDYPTGEAGARRATSASTSSSRCPPPSCSRARFCRASPGSSSGSAPTHVTSVLRGHASEQVVARGHDRLSTFGLLPDASVAEVRGYIEQLTGLGLLQQAGDAYPVLALTPKGLDLLRDETSCPGPDAGATAPESEESAPRARSRAEAESWQDVDRALFERLRGGSARNRAVARRAAVRDLPRRHASRDGPPAADIARRAC